jgi:hypothetical protein
MTKKENNELETFAKAHADAFTQLSEIEGIIIRGHILVERAINNAIEHTVINKEDYKSDRFTFSQKVIISNMFGLSSHFKLEINTLNKLRNQIAHTLEYDVKNVDIIINEIHKKEPKFINLEDSKIESLGKAISFMCGAIFISHEDFKFKIIVQHLENTIKKNT